MCFSTKEGSRIHGLQHWLLRLGFSPYGEAHRPLHAATTTRMALCSAAINHTQTHTRRRRGHWILFDNPITISFPHAPTTALFLHRGLRFLPHGLCRRPSGERSTIYVLITARRAKFSTHNLAHQKFTKFHRQKFLKAFTEKNVTSSLQMSAPCQTGGHATAGIILLCDFQHLRPRPVGVCGMHVSTTMTGRLCWAA